MRDYAYGDSPVAIERLRLLAEIFAPSTDRLLDRLALEGPRAVVDLGCGPGETTRLLADRFPDADVVGVDSSAELVRAARDRHGARARFVVADVTESPLPPADLIYARLLLAHLRDPTKLVERWTKQLAPAGVLVVEEVERIVTDDELFRRHLDLAAAPLKARGSDLFVGSTLAAMPGLASTIDAVQPSGPDAAAMFALNLKTLRHDPVVEARYDTAELDELAAALGERARRGGGKPIRWEMRQLVMSREH